MKIVGYVDFYGTEIENQIQTAKKIDLNHIILRKYNNKNLYELTNEDIKQLNKTIKEEKINIVALDPEINSYDLYNIDSYEEILTNYQKVIDLANQIKVNDIFYRLPKIVDIINEFETFENQLVPLLDILKRNNKRFLIVQTEEKTSVLAYIMNKYYSKNFSLVFNPKQIVLNNESVTTSYRLLKRYFSYFIANDMDSKNNPELLGYGRVNILDVFKRMIRDKYDGTIILDIDFANFLLNYEEKKVSFLKKLFGFKEKNILKKYIEGYSLRIFPHDDTKIADIYDIYESQIKAIKVIFNLR